VAVLPLGTANVVARDLGLPLDPQAAARAILAAAPRPVDIGEVRWVGGSGRPSGERRRFVLSVGAGAVAEAVAWAEAANRAAPAAKRALGRWLYAAALVRALTAPAPVVVEVGGERLDGIAAISIVTRHYAGGLLPAADARVGDGLIDLLIIGGRLACLAAAAGGLAGLPARGLGVRHRRVESFRIISAGPLEIDGDAAPPGPVDLRVAGRLRMLGLHAGKHTG
jgi:diacylglycerol kinase family enzyme